MHLNSFSRACLVAFAVVSVAGCADTHWERALYQGARYGSEQCQIKRNPADAPCAELPDYRSYERERAKARSTAIDGEQP